jgi:hypothetical protein
MSSEILLIQEDVSKVPFLSKLYIWSVQLHPLLFFYIAHEGVIGIGGNISKILEFVVSFSIALAILFFHRHSFMVSFKGTGIYWIFILYSIIVGVFGFFSGYYQTDNLNTSNQAFLTLEYVRPILDYIIAIFYFFYFVVLASYFLSNDKAINYFFKVFFLLFFANLSIGLIDIVFTVFFNFDLVPISLVRDQTTSYRFHGLSGEPRDAFVYLIFGIAMIYLFDAWKIQKKRRFFLFTLILIALTMTVSVSGLLGLFFSIGLIIFYQLGHLNLKKLFIAFIILIFLGFVVYLNYISFVRMDKYLGALPILLDGLTGGPRIPEVFVGQLPNIYPVFDRFLEISNGNVLPTIFGTGYGTESVVNVNIIESNDYSIYPNAQVVRLFYSVGIIGLLIFLFAFYYPVAQIAKFTKNQIWIYLILILLGSTLAHRSVVLFIFFGIFLAVFRQFSKKKCFKK